MWQQSFPSTTFLDIPFQLTLKLFNGGMLNITNEVCFEMGDTNGKIGHIFIILSWIAEFSSGISGKFIFWYQLYSKKICFEEKMENKILFFKEGIYIESVTQGLSEYTTLNALVMPIYAMSFLSKYRNIFRPSSFPQGIFFCWFNAPN